MICSGHIFIARFVCPCGDAACSNSLCLFFTAEPDHEDILCLINEHGLRDDWRRMASDHKYQIVKVYIVDNRKPPEPGNPDQYLHSKGANHPPIQAPEEREI